MIKINGKEVSLDRFPDGTFHLKPNMDFDHESYCNNATIEWKFEGNDEMAALMFLTRHLQENGVIHVNLIMPYIPNARQDRVKSEKDVFTLKYFAEFINNLHFHSVTVLDPHSSVSEALINRLTVEDPKRFINTAVRKVYDEIREDMRFTDSDYEPQVVAFYPDEGAMKRYSGLIKLPYAFGIKKRDWETGEIQGLDVAGSTELINGNYILIIDDICSRGGTFYHSAKKLKELGSRRIYLYITHCEGTIADGEIFKSGLIDKVFTTDSIFTSGNKSIPNDMIEVVGTV